MTLSEQYPNEMLPVKVVLLTQSQYTIVDPEDYDRVVQYRWQTHRGQTGELYARRGRGIGYACQYMHTLITGYAETDHKSSDGLDNRRCSLREATHQQNSANSKHRLGASGYRGVSWHRLTNKWQAQISNSLGKKYLGTFLDKEEAARAYDTAAKERYGEFARLNFPKEHE